ncbi:MerR family DNA-binding protein [Ralstonia solanacearum]|uniref:MerR family DNA-binding protein n=1 Tax=Ralstonia solanacearum TaxID=305 RepID=UPI00399D7587
MLIFFHAISPTAPNVLGAMIWFCYKRYSELSLQRIRLIIHAKALGFTLAEINDVIHVWDSPTFAVAQKVACLQAKLTELDEKSHALTMLRAGLLNAMAKVGSDCVEGQIAW